MHIAHHKICQALLRSYIYLLKFFHKADKIRHDSYNIGSAHILVNQMDFQEFIANLTQEDLDLITQEFNKRQNKIPIYKYSKIRDVDLRILVDIEENLDIQIFNTWINHDITLSPEVENFLAELIQNNQALIKSYNEEELKVKFLGLLFYKVNFKSLENNFRDYYELPLTYKTDNFILSGTIDFAVSKGLVYSQRPYFFIQEFKQGEKYSNPRPQLLAELILYESCLILSALWKNFKR
ncbi:hypothetical protein TI05_18070 [Achromatium sp. WMS3]|nr:hypothetical protein TI05_18070 [Achromatium sp. WMS3]